MIGWLNSLMFWALLGLLVPLAIHFWNKREMKVLKVGSIKIYQADDSPKARSIFFSEPLLWFLRSLIVLLLTLILVEPFVVLAPNESANTTETLNLVEPSLWPTLQPQLQDSSVKYLAEGFPRPQPNATISSDSSNYWDLLFQLSEGENPPQRVRIFTQALPKNFRGEVPKLNFETEWVLINQQNKKQRPISAWYREDSVYVTEAIFEDYLVRLGTNASTKEELSALKDQLPIAGSLIINVSIIAKPQHQNEVNHLLKALKTLEQFTLTRFKISIDSILTDDAHTDWCFSFSESEPIASNSSGNMVWRNSNTVSDDWFEFKPTKSSKHWEMNGLLLEEQQDAEKLSKLPEALMALFAPSFLLDQGVQAVDPRSISLSELSQNQQFSSEKLASALSDYPLSNLIWIVLLLVLAAERIISSNKNQ